MKELIYEKPSILKKIAHIQRQYNKYWVVKNYWNAFISVVHYQRQTCWLNVLVDESAQMHMKPTAENIGVSSMMPAGDRWCIIGSWRRIYMEVQARNGARSSSPAWRQLATDGAPLVVEGGSTFRCRPAMVPDFRHQHDASWWQMVMMPAAKSLLQYYFAPVDCYANFFVVNA